MKIGITCYPTHGGSGVVATELGMELAKRGHEVHFISYALPFRLKQFQENVVFHEVQMLAYPLFQYPPYTLALAAKLAEVATRTISMSCTPITPSRTRCAPTWRVRSRARAGSRS